MLVLTFVCTASLGYKPASPHFSIPSPPLPPSFPLSLPLPSLPPSALIYRFTLIFYKSLKKGVIIETSFTRFLSLRFLGGSFGGGWGWGYDMEGEGREGCLLEVSIIFIANTRQTTAEAKSSYPGAVPVGKYLDSKTTMLGRVRSVVFENYFEKGGDEEGLL
jgi:hypothetical protein